MWKIFFPKLSPTESPWDSSGDLRVDWEGFLIDAIETTLPWLVFEPLSGFIIAGDV